MMVGNTSLFSVDASSGWVSLLAPLDFETRRSHSIVVRAADNGSTPLFADVVVRVDVLDANDNAPVLQRLMFIHRMPENTLDGMPAPITLACGQTIRVRIAQPHTNHARTHAYAHHSTSGGFHVRRLHSSILVVYIQAAHLLFGLRSSSP